jgi:hypothetical protein
MLSTKPFVIRRHDRLDHPSMRIIDRVVRENKLPCSSLEYNKESVCDACRQGKIHQLAFPKSTSVSLAPLDLVHSDVWVLHPHLLEGKIIMLVLLMISQIHLGISHSSQIRGLSSLS